MKIGVIGLGLMGSAIAANLLKAGHHVTVWNRSKGPVEALAAQGARTAGKPEDAMQGDAVISMLANDAVIREMGLDGALLEKAAKNLVHINMATISVALAKDMAAAHEARGLGYVAAPVFGRPEAAAAGQLVIALAGARDVLARLDPLFAQMGRRHMVVGDAPEHASLFKIAGNFMIANALETMGECFALLAKGGVDPKLFHTLMTETIFAAPIYQNYGRLALSGQYDNVGFFLKLGLKDVKLAAEAARDLNVPLPLAPVVAGHLEEAVAEGLGDKDWTAVASVIAKKAGV